MFTKAITRTPSPEIIHGITTAELGEPDFEKALKQHQAYVEALRSCGLEVSVLAPYSQFPDATFVEDVALCTADFAIITRPGALSRREEIALIESVLSAHFDRVERIQSPGTLEAGDVMMVGNTFYIGLSERTNAAGANQLIAILEKNGMKGIVVKLEEVLHLKTGLSYLENNVLLVGGEFIEHPEFESFQKIIIDEDEAYAANSLWVNGKVLVPKGFPKTLQKIEAVGYETIEVDVSEFQKVDGGLSCLSLRF